MCKGPFHTMTWLRPSVLSLKFVVAMGVGWLILALALPALSDAAPPEQARGSRLGPAEVTQVRMPAEIKSLVDGPLLLVPPLQAWTIAADGVVFVLDADNIVHQLDPTDLTPLAQSDLLDLGAVSIKTPAHLVADENHLFVGSQAISQTLVLNRDDFTPVTTLRHAGPMALDPGRHLFIISAQTGQLLAYNLADLSELPQGIPFYCLPVDLAVNPVSRRLYLHNITSCGSSHHAEGYAVYDLDTLTGRSTISNGSAFYGYLTRPVAIEDAGLTAGLHLPYGNYRKLFTFDGQGDIVTQKYLPYLGGEVAMAAHGDWLYLSYERGLAVMRVGDLALQSFFPFTTTVPSGLGLSPDGTRLYLFGDRVATYTTTELQRLGLATVSPVPLAWIQAVNNFEVPQVRVYRSPDFAQDGVAFTQMLPAGNPLWAELYPGDYEHFQNPDPLLTHQVTALSFSPDFATDHTLVTDFRRSTDSGKTWTPWMPRLAFVSERTGNREIYTANEQGNNLQRVTGNPAADENPAWSPAWTRLAFQSNRSGNWDIFSLKAECTPAQVECDLHQLTDDRADDMLPAWSPDGRWIAFVSTRDGNPEIYVMDKDGQNQRRLTFNPSGDWRPAWLPDSQRLVFTSDRRGNNDIYLLTVPLQEAAPLTAEPVLTSVVTGPADDRDPAIGVSPQFASAFQFDSQVLLFFSSDRTGTMKTYVTLPDGSTTAVEPFGSANQAQAHPSWFQNTLLVAVGEAHGSDIYGLTPAGSSQARIAAPGFDGQPAGGPVWWQPTPLDLTTETATPTPAPVTLSTPPPQPTLTPMPTSVPTLTSTTSLTSPNMTPVGHLGGRINAVFVHDGYAYLGMDTELSILDVSNPVQPSRVGYLLQGVRDVEVVGHLAYLATYYGLRIVDVSVPSVPKEIGFYQTPDFVNGLTVVNNKVYLAGRNGLWILDVSDPTAPVELGFCALTQVISNDVVVRGDKAYVATATDISRAGGLSLVDISDPARPAEISRLQLGDWGSAWDLGLVDNWVYVTTGSADLSIINVADPTQPVQSRVVRKHTDPQEAAMGGLAVISHYLYTASRSGWHIADISDPTKPVEVSFTPLPPPINAISVVNDYAYVVSGAGLHIFDIADPATPTQVGLYLAPNGTVDSIAGQDHYLYLVSSQDIGGSNALNVIDVANPDWPAQVSRYPVPEAVWGVRVQGHYLYLAKQDLDSSHKGSIQILDISNPISLTEVSRYDLPGPVFGLTVAGNYAYVNVGGLLIIDISNPATPRQATYAPTLPGTVVAVVGNYAYALDLTSGLYVIDLAQPAAPVDMGAIEELGGKRYFNIDFMTVAGDRLYVTAGADGLHVFDISNPAQPAEVGFYPDPSEQVVVRNGTIFVSSRYTGLYLFQAIR